MSDNNKNKVDFQFDEEKHVYTLNGKRLYGVTSVLGVIAKNALIQWSANEAVKYVKDAIYEVDHIKKDWLEKVLEEARTAHRRKKDKAADVGTQVHQAIEEWIKGLIDKDIDKSIKVREELDEKACEMFDNFTNWVVENNVKFIASEKRIYSEEMWCAGTVDMLFEKDGKKYIGDIKTTSGIYGREPFLQCAAYDLMLGSKADGYCIVRLGKDGSFEEVYSYDLEGDRTAFKAALTLFKQLEQFKFNAKARLYPNKRTQA